MVCLSAFLADLVIGIAKQKILKIKVWVNNQEILTTYCSNSKKLLYSQLMIRAILKNGSRIFSQRQSNIFSAAAILAATFSLSALLGILRDRLLYARFYACCASALDAYNAAFRIPDIIFRLLVIGALSAAFIPIFSQQFVRSKAEAYRTASAVINILSLVFLFFTFWVMILARPLSGLIASGFSLDQILLMSRLTRLMVLAQWFFLLSNFLTGVLQSCQRFLLPALAPIVYNLGIIFGIQVLAQYWGIFGPALGVVIGAALHFLIQLPLVINLGFRYSPIFSLRLVGVRKILKLMGPRTLSLGLSEIEATVALFLASTLPTGSLSLFYLAQRLTQFFARLFGTTIGQASLPILSREADQRHLESFRRTLITSLLQAVYLALPTGIILLVLRVPLVRLAYGAQEFPWRATITTGRVVAFFAPLVVINTLSDILIRGFYALQDTRTPLLASMFSLGVNIVIALWTILGLRLGVVGLALAIVVSALAQAALLLFLLLKRLSSRSVDWYQQLWQPLTQMGLVALLSGWVAWLLLRGLDYYVFDTSRIVGLVALTLISSSVALTIYLALTLGLGLIQAQAIFNLIRRGLGWLKPKTPLLELPPMD